MKMVYISHPYTGNEEYNVDEAHYIAKDLSNQFPDIVFINPLNVFKHLQNSNLSYSEIMKQCIELMNHCDAMIMTGDYRSSKGCMMEYNNAKCPIFEGVSSFRLMAFGKDDIYCEGKKKVFISVPVYGRTKDEVKIQKEEIMEKLEKYNSNLVLLDSWIDKSDNSLECLGKSLIIMASADIVVFGIGWEDSRGCQVEHACAGAYGKIIVYM